MRVLFIGGVFSRAVQAEVEADAKRAVEYSANVFQEKLIGGFIENGVEVDVLSAPFIGSYPQYSNTLSFKGFDADDAQYEYVHFNNLWGFRNISREKALKHAVDAYVDALAEGTQLLVIAYSPHTPIIAAALHAKQRYESCRTCAVIPDLPQFTNLEKGRKPLYSLLKGRDANRFESMIGCFDHVIVLTDQMGQALGLQSDQYDVVEGILRSDFHYAFDDNPSEDCSETRIVYTGKLYEKFGALDLAGSMAYIDDPSVKLILCGTGDCMSQLEEMARADSRIVLTGQVSPEEALELQRTATVLVNPRSNDSEFAKYSFPSKNLEYLSTGKPVVCYLLDGMPSVYSEFVFVIAEDDESDSAIADAISLGINAVRMASTDKYDAFYNYAKGRLMPKQIASLIAEKSFYR